MNDELMIANFTYDYDSGCHFTLEISLNMDTAVGKRGLPKFRDILRRAPTDSEVR